MTVTAPKTALHPLEPLSAAEVEAAAGIIKAAAEIPDGVRFAQLTLHEPTKAELAGGTTPPRRAFANVLDRTSGEVLEVVVDLGAEAVVDVVRRRDVQPPIMLEEFFLAGAVVREDPAWQEAVRKRGVEDFSKVQVDPWVTGNFGLEWERGRRVLRAVSYYREEPTDNGYARPLEGIVAYVDLNEGRVIRLEDNGVKPLRADRGRYQADANPPRAEPLRPLEITQPEGPSFEVDGHHVRWQRWSFRLSLHPTEGLVLHDVRYDDPAAGRSRSVLHRVSVSEMVVPYGDPSPQHGWKNAFDAGEYGLGKLANSLTLGCDCLGEIRYFDGVVVTEDGDPAVIENAICMHEEDYGILWKHFDVWTDDVAVRRSRRLVVSAIHTVGNYEYGFFWYFYLDGTIQLEIKLTGVLQTMAMADGERSECAAMIAPNLAGPNHQHLFNIRLDWDLDGTDNTVVEVEAEPLPLGPGNPYGAAFRTKTTTLESERAAQRDANPALARHWRVINPHVTNQLGEPVGYKVALHSAARLLAHPESSVARRATFATHNVWVTPYEPSERHAAGDYPNQHPGGAGLPEWTAADRSVVDTDIVMWVTTGITHMARPEDFPVMPVEYAGFSLVPQGFFDRNPALDVPEPPGHCHP